MNAEDLRVKCSLCGIPIPRGDGSAWEVRITAFSNWEHAITNLYFHADCYPEGKNQLIKQFATAYLPMDGEIRFDPRDQRTSMNQSQARGAKGSIEFDEMLEWLKKAGWGILNASIFMGFGAYLSAAGGDGPRAAVPGMIAGLICWIVGSRIRGLAGELLGGTIFGAIIGWFTKDYGGTKGAVVGALIVDGIILIYAAYQYIAARLKRQ